MPIRSQILRVDALDKVIGKALYAGDFYREDMLFGVIVRSTRPHAWIKRIDLKEALELEGIVKVLTYKDIPGENIYGIIKKDQPLLAVDKVRYVGEPIAIVIGVNEAIARKGAKLVKIDYEDIQVISDPFIAIDSPIWVHKDGNLLCCKRVIKGDIERGLAESDVVIEREYKTTWLDHAFLETETGFGYIEKNGRIVIISSTQNVHYKRKEVSRILGLPEDKIRIIQAITGGGFGGKLDMTVEGYVALSVYHTKRPVLIRLNREESFLSNTKRHPLYIKYTTGIKKDGSLSAVRVHIIGDTGAYASYGETVALRAAIHATGPYEVPNVYVESRMYYTNNPISGAMRGFGVPQMAFAHESQMDIGAKEIGLDPLEIRFKNALKEGALTATSQRLEKSVGFIETLKAIEPFWRERIYKGDNGFGLGCMFYGIGNTGIPNPSRAQIKLNEEGKICLHIGACEIGQGSDTVFVQIMCEVLEVEPKHIVLIRADTDLTEDAGSTSASRQTYISGRAVFEAAIKLRKFLEREGFYKNKSLKDIVLKYKELGYPVFEGFFDPPVTKLDPDTSQGVPYATYAFATHMAEVIVDTAIGSVKVKRIYAAHDVGKAINVTNIKSQIYGGIAMGIGFALMEKFEPGKVESLDKYYIPTSMDMPDEVQIMLIEDEEPTGPFGAKGVGEPALIPVAPSIINAIADAIGVRVFELPCDIEKLKITLEENRRG
jgi:CO/xanthine dehydrogenase Mo-binding subunit